MLKFAWSKMLHIAEIAWPSLCVRKREKEGGIGFVYLLIMTTLASKTRKLDPLAQEN